MRGHQRAAAPVLTVASALFLMTAAAPAQAQTSAYTAHTAPNPVIDRLQIRVDTLDTELRSMTGRLETMGFELNQARKTAKEADDRSAALEVVIETLEARIAALESILNAPLDEAAGAADDPASAVVSLVGPTDPATREALAAERSDDGELASKQPDVELAEDPAELYKQARSLLLKGDFPSAETAFSTYLERHSDLENAGEAQYWLGESLLVQEAYPEAAAAYVALLTDYPDAPKAPDGLVKLARSLRLLGEAGQACAALDELPTRYPDASAVTRSLAATERSRAECS
ncbi:MAG: tol-pal system protein YbgF [Pseudomonadota bacterium]